MIHVVMVCLGNICRSPMAEAVFLELLQQAGLAEQVSVDSAGTAGYHQGESAHAGTRRVLMDHGIAYHGHSRQVSREDMAPQNYVVAMDHSNVRDLERRFGRHPRLSRLLDFAPETAVRDVPDPYYHNNFAEVYDLVHDGAAGLLAHIRAENSL